MRLEQIAQKLIDEYEKNPKRNISEDSKNKARKLSLESFHLSYNGNHNQEMELFMQALDNNPYESMVLHNLGEILSINGYNSEALDIFNIMIDLNEDHSSVSSAFCEIGKMCYRQGNFEVAETYYNKAIETYPSNPDSYQNKAILYDEKESNNSNIKKLIKAKKSSVLNSWSYFEQESSLRSQF